MSTGNLATTAPALLLLSGYPGSGKTTFARALAAALPFEHVESDAIRLGLFPKPSYTPMESARVFATAEARAAAALRAGRHALIDATNLTRSERRRFVRLADRVDAAFVGIRVTAPDAEIRRRLQAPREGASQAGVAVYERMAGRAQPFAGPAIVVDTRFDIAPAVALVLHLVQREPA